MAVSTWLWVGGIGDPSRAGNWGLLSGPGDAMQAPQSGDTAIALSGTIVTPSDAQIANTTIRIGGTSGTAGISFSGDAALSLAAPSLDSLSSITSVVPNVFTAEQTQLNAAGTFINAGTILATAQPAAVSRSTCCRGQPARRDISSTAARLWCPLAMR